VHVSGYATPLLAKMPAPLYLRAAAGCFAAHLILGKVEDNMLDEDQVPVARAPAAVFKFGL